MEVRKRRWREIKPDSLCKGSQRKWFVHTEDIDRVVETVARTVEELNDEVEGSAELCEDTLFVNIVTETEGEETDVQDRDRSEEDPVTRRVVVLTDREEVAWTEVEGAVEELLPPTVPEGTPPRLK